MRVASAIGFTVLQVAGGRYGDRNLTFNYAN